jgi:deoxyribonuclease-4
VADHSPLLPPIGAHVDQDDPISAARDRSAELAQFFLGDPQGWKQPVVAYTGGAAGLRADAESAHIGLYVHAPYVINVATTNNRIRIPSRKLLQQHVDGAAEIGARGLIVHGGHVLKEEDAAVGVDNWRKTFERIEMRCPILIENTAGGANAMARQLDAIARLWEVVGEHDIGFCLDTCHAHAGGIELATAVDAVRAITGRIDLVHCNDSRDAFGSGADRHTNIGTGQLDQGALADLLAAAGAPILVETPAEGQAGDIAWIRDRLRERIAPEPIQP